MGAAARCEAEHQGSAARGCQGAVDLEKQVLKLQVCCAGHRHLNAMTGSLGSLGTRLRTATRRPHQTATQEFREASRTTGRPLRWSWPAASTGSPTRPADTQLIVIDNSRPGGSAPATTDQV